MSAASSQWRTGPWGFVGLDYAALYLVAATLGLTVDEGLLRKIQLLEHADLERRNRRPDG